jgi:hypothetical protein
MKFVGSLSPEMDLFAWEIVKGDHVLPTNAARENRLEVPVEVHALIFLENRLAVLR